MKMIYINCNISVLTEIINILEQEHAVDYQVVKEVTGKHRHGDPRFNTSVWPGYNAVIFAPFDDEDKAGQVIDKLKDYNNSVHNEDEIVVCCTWNMEEYIN